KKKKQRNFARFFVIGLIIFIIIYVTSAGAIGKYISNIIAPKLGISDDTKEDELDTNPNQNEDKDIEDKKDNDGEVKKISESIEVSPLSISAIQMGAFSTKDNANERVKEIQNGGGGGYIVEDNFFRV